MLSKTTYIGRFAPSPTGHLHLGSLYTALASFLHARAHQGQWLLRIDDLDHYRLMPGASTSIINSLKLHGLIWDGAIAYQSEQLNVYQSVIKQLEQRNLSYPCICTRKALRSTGSSVYSGNCLNAQVSTKTHSIRIKSKALEISFKDEIQALQIHNLTRQHGDFIIKRKDNIVAYQLAVVIDDARQKITHVIRGFDLLDSTPKQIYLQQTLGYLTPIYCHVPILTDQNGHKLSKQTFAQAVPTETPEKTLFLLLKLLKQAPPIQLKKASVKEIIDWGIKHWQTTALKKIRAIDGDFY